MQIVHLVALCAVLTVTAAAVLAASTHIRAALSFIYQHIHKARTTYLLIRTH